MKKIGQGWQYTIYDLQNGRVLKKYNSIPAAYLQMIKACFPFQRTPLWDLPKFYKGCKETAADSMKKISNPVLEGWMMGNPKILNELDYEQDKLLPLHDFFASADLQKKKQAADAFVEFNKMLVQKSLIDKSFNISKNFALDQQGRVVLMDLGELYSSQVAIEKQIQKRAWATHYVVDPLPADIKFYFVERMDAAFGV